jgi:hypothetical protein
MTRALLAAAMLCFAAAAAARAKSDLRLPDGQTNLREKANFLASQIILNPGSSKAARLAPHRHVPHNYCHLAKSA